MNDKEINPEFYPPDILGSERDIDPYDIDPRHRKGCIYRYGATPSRGISYNCDCPERSEND